MTSVILPYEVWELILGYLDGASLLAVSCVSRRCLNARQSFLSVKSSDYWKEACLKELRPKDLKLCFSGLLEENWLAVYKSSMLCNTIRARTVRSTSIPLVNRFIRDRTGLHILGSMVVITQGPLIRVFDAFSGKHLANQQIGTYRIHNSFLMRKKQCKEEDEDDEDSQILPCDVLVMLCGGSVVSHLAVATAHTILDSPPVCVPLRLNLSVAESTCIHPCKWYNNRVCYGNLYSLEIEFNKKGKITFNMDEACEEPCNESMPLKGHSDLNRHLSVSFQESDEIVISSLKQCGDSFDVVVPVETHLWHKTSSRKSDWARIVHVGDEIVPVIVTLQSHPTASKHVVLYTFPLY